MTRREQIEKHQVWFYLLAVVAGVSLGLWLRPEVADALIYVPLGLLLYATFAQVPITHLSAAMRDRRYLSATLLANFVLVPVAVWLLAWLVPREPAILLGVYMVLLVPCTDWFIVFSHLGRGDAKLAITSTPLISWPSSCFCRCICGCSWGRPSAKSFAPVDSSRSSYC